VSRGEAIVQIVTLNLAVLFVGWLIIPMWIWIALVSLLYYGIVWVLGVSIDVVAFMFICWAITNGILYCWLRLHGSPEGFVLWRRSFTARGSPR